MPHISRGNKLTHSPTTSGQEYELFDWLKKITFPMEVRFADVDFARQAYSLIVKRMIDSGVLETFPSILRCRAFNSDAVDNHLLLLWNVAP